MRVHEENPEENSAPLLASAADQDDRQADQKACVSRVSSLSASFSLVKSILGAGSFALPWAFLQSGYILGPVLLLFMAEISRYTLVIVVRCRELALKTQGGEASMTTYVDVARAAFGAPGAISCYVASLCSSVGVCGAYLVFVSKSLHSLLPPALALEWTPHSILFLILPLPVALTLNKNDSLLAVSSALGDVAVCAGMLVVVAFALLYYPPSIASLAEGRIPAAKWDTLPLAFGDIAFLFCVHFLVLPIATTMKQPQEFKTMSRRSVWFCALASAAFGFIGCASFGLDTQQAVILNLDLQQSNRTHTHSTTHSSSPALFAATKLLLCADLLFTYPVVMRPSIQLLEHSAMAHIRMHMGGGGTRSRRGGSDSSGEDRDRDGDGDEDEDEDERGIEEEGSSSARDPAERYGATDAAGCDGAVIGAARDKEAGGARMMMGRKTFATQSLVPAIIRISLGLLAAAAATLVPAFAVLSGLVGGVSQTFLAFVLPPLMFLRLSSSLASMSSKQTLTMTRAESQLAEMTGAATEGPSEEHRIPMSNVLLLLTISVFGICAAGFVVSSSLYALQDEA